MMLPNLQPASGRAVYRVSTSQTVNRLRPFARRAFSTCLPAFVAIRDLKP